MTIFYKINSFQKKEVKQKITKMLSEMPHSNIYH